MNKAELYLPTQALLTHYIESPCFKYKAQCSTFVRYAGILMLLISSAATYASTIYEDAEDGSADRWSVHDNSPSGASVSNRADLDSGSRVIELSGGGTSNAYILGGFNNAEGWNNTLEHVLTWKMQTEEAFILNVRLDTTFGARYIRYKNTDAQPRLIRNTVDHGLGEDVVDGQWHSFSRNLDADLKSGEPDNAILAVNGFLVRGDIVFDDIALGVADEVSVFNANAGVDQTAIFGNTVFLDASGSESIPNGITSYLWTDDNNNVVASGATPAIVALDIGVYTFSLVVTNSIGETDTDSVQISVVEASSGTGSIYEDAEDGQTFRWSIEDSSPLGATITNAINSVTGSRVITTSGDGKANGYLLGGLSPSAGWNNTSEFVLSWDMLATSDVILNIRVETNSGTRYMRYKNTDASSGQVGSNIDIGLGGDAADGTWRSFSRNLVQDLQAFSPDASMLAVHGFYIRGDVSLDNIGLSSAVSQNAPIARAGNDQSLEFGEAVSLDGSASTAGSSALVSYQWLEGETVLSNDITTLITSLPLGPHSITLVVTDEQGQTNSDTVLITLTAAPVVQAQAGDDQSIEFGEAVSLDGSGSTAGSSAIVSYQWLEGETLLSNGITTLLVGLPLGPHTITLVVTDEQAQTSSDTVLITINAPTNPNSGSIYEDAEDGQTLRWSIKDSSPSGATITNAIDSVTGSRVITTSGNGKDNGYLLGDVSSSSGWNNTSEFVLSWDMLASSNFILNIRVETVLGTRYLRYKNTNSAISQIGSTIDIGLGSDAIDGTWRSYSRNLEQDLQAFAPEDSMLAVHGFYMRGDVSLDNIGLSSGVSQDIPIAQAGTDQSIELGDGVSLDGSGSTAGSSAIVSYQWLDGDTVLSDLFNAQIIGLPLGPHTFTLVVTDGQGQTSSDTVLITVAAVPVVQAQAGEDQSLELGEVVALDGSGSKAGSSAIASYQWLEGETVLSNDITTLIPDLPLGPHSITLVVTDEQGQTSSDIVLITINSPSNPSDGSIYEDAEDGETFRWTVRDDSPSGATISNVFDSVTGSRVITTSGDGKANGYLLGGLNSSTGWNNTSEIVLSWDMLASTDFILNIRVDTVLGTRYLRYKNTNSAVSQVGTTIDTGLGSGVIDGTWRSYSRNLVQDLQAFAPEDSLLVVHGFYISGDVSLDNIELSSGVSQDSPIAQAGDDQSIVVGEQVSLDGSGSTMGSSPIVSYQWLAGESVLSNDFTALITDLPLGLHDITLVVTDAQGLSSTDTVLITVTAVPVLHADAGDDQSVEVGNNVSLDGTGSGAGNSAIASYQWLEGETLLSEEPNPTISGLLLGLHSITLVVTDEQGQSSSDTVQISVTVVLVLPQAQAGEDQSIALGEAVSLDASGSTEGSGAIAGYQWFEGETLLSAELNPTITDLPLGLHRITLVVTDDQGHSSNDTVLITITVPPVLQAQAGEDKSVILGDDVSLYGAGSTAGSSAIVSYQWLEGETLLSEETNLSIIGGLPIGSHIITLLVTDGEAQSSSDTVQITIVSDANNIYVDASTGNDLNNGERVNPFKTISRAVEALLPGMTLILREGTYFERNITVGTSGTSEAPIVIKNFPDEQVIVDGSYPEFQVVADGNWELVDSGIQLYRSVQTDYFNDYSVASLLSNNALSTSLVTYIDEPDEGGNGLLDLNSAIQGVSSLPRYVGPGVFNEEGRIYIRLVPLDSDSINGAIVHQPPSADPNELELLISPVQPVFELRASHVQFSGFQIRGGSSGIEFSGIVSDVLIDSMNFVGLPSGIYIEGQSSNITVDGSVFDSYFPDYLAWTDLKGGSSHSKPGSHWINRRAGIISTFIQGLTVLNSEFNDVFDGLVLSGDDIKVYRNSGNFIDDMIQLGSDSSHVEIFENRIEGAGPSHHGRGNSLFPGTTYIYQNVIDSRSTILWKKRDDENLLSSDPYFYSIPPFGRHNINDLVNGDPWNIYNNTVLFDSSWDKSDAGYQLWGRFNSTSQAHQVLNNIFLETGGGAFTESLNVNLENQIYDGNIYWSTPAVGSLHKNFETSAGNERDFTTLEEFLSSADFESSKLHYPPGWDFNSLQADPLLNSNFVPAANGPAAIPGVELPADFFHRRILTYRGALEPQ